MKRRYLIIGSGAAGVAAAQTLRQADPGGQVCLVSSDPHGYYSRPGLAYYLTKEIDENQLFPLRPGVLRNLGVEWVTGHAVRLDPDSHRVVLQDGRALPYDRLLLAPGAHAVLPDLPGISLAGVVKLDHLEDTRRIIKQSRRGAEAVVIGGGITALELVEGLVARGMKVHYLMRGERYWSNVLDTVESQMVVERLKTEGVQIHTGAQISEILGRHQVEGVRTQQGEILRCRMVALAVGIHPQLELALSGGLQVRRGIVTDETLQTSAHDVFAAGDAAEVTDPRSGETILESLWNPAQQQGRLAAGNLAGGRQAYQRTAPVNVTRLAGLVTTIIGQVGEAKSGHDHDLKGIMRGDSETWRQVSDAIVAKSYTNASRLRLFVGEHTLRGALVMGEQSLSRPLQHLIEHAVDISPIRTALLDPQADLLRIIRNYDSDFFLTRANSLENAAQV